MKKYISCLCVLALPLFVSAQNFNVWNSFHESHKGKDIVTKVDNWFAAHEKLPWVKAVEKEIYRAEPHGYMGSNTWIHITPMLDGKVTYSIARLFEHRTDAVNAALRQNPTLQRFRIVSPDPQVLVNLPDEHMAYILGFLKAPTTVQKADKKYTPVEVKTFQRFLVSVALKPNKNAKPVYLIFNAYTKQMYVAYAKLQVPGVEFKPLGSPTWIR